jgi:hypothetical protein
MPFNFVQYLEILGRELVVKRRRGRYVMGQSMYYSRFEGWD